MLWGKVQASTHLCTPLGCYSEHTTARGSLAPRLRLPWHIRAVRLAARGWFPLGSVPMAYGAAGVCWGAQLCPLIRGEEDEGFQQGLTRNDISLLLFFSQLWQQGEICIPSSHSPFERTRCLSVISG